MYLSKPCFFSSINVKSQRVFHCLCEHRDFIHLHGSPVFHPMTTPLCVHFPTDRHVGCFQLLVITNLASVNIPAHVCFPQAERFSRPQSLHLGRELLSHTVCAYQNLLMPYCDPKCLSQCLPPPPRVSVVPQANRIYSSFIFATLGGVK